jgi:hypothetical protein
MNLTINVDVKLIFFYIEPILYPDQLQIYFNFFFYTFFFFFFLHNKDEIWFTA